MTGQTIVFAGMFVAVCCYRRMPAVWRSVKATLGRLFILRKEMLLLLVVGWYNCS
eukprot:m.109828 g.109828  ORF g.109828 m.109828 type:complete len:55 (-) comp15999_c1_seq2:1090-1254(-)